MGNTRAGQEPRSLGATLWAGITGHCPNCGRGKLFDGYLTLAPRCNVCGLDYDFADSGDGPAVFVILVTGFIVVGAALIVEVLYAPPYWLHALALGLALDHLAARPAPVLQGRAHRPPVQAQGRRGQARLRTRRIS